MNIFTKEYWIASCNDLKKLGKIGFALLICALTIILDGFLSLNLFEGQPIRVSFFVVAIGCAVYGPLAGMAVSVLANILTCVIFPAGHPFHIGYIISELFIVLFYCAFLYRRNISVWKLFFAKVFINYFVQAFLNSLWAADLAEEGTTYLSQLSTGLILNSLLLPAEVLLLSLIFRGVIPVFAHIKLLPVHSEEALSKLGVTKNVFPILGFSAMISSGAALYYGLVSDGGVAYKWLGIFLLAGGLALLVTGVVLEHKKKNQAAIEVVAQEE